MGIGELQDDWNDFLDKLKAKNLSGKTVAISDAGILPLLAGLSAMLLNNL